MKYNPTTKIGDIVQITDDENRTYQARVCATLMNELQVESTTGKPNQIFVSRSWVDKINGQDVND